MQSTEVARVLTHPDVSLKAVATLEGRGGRALKRDVLAKLLKSSESLEYLLLTQGVAGAHRPSTEAKVMMKLL